MARLQRKGSFVYADPSTMGPIGTTFAPDTTTQASLFAAGDLAKIRALANFFRAGLINANLGSAAGGEVAAAQNGTHPYVKPLTTTGGQFAAALAAFTETYVQAEWVAVYTLMGQILVCLTNAGVCTATAAVTPYTSPRRGKHMIRDFRIGGTIPPAMDSPGAAYTKTEIDKIVAVMEFCRHLCVYTGIARDSTQISSISVLNDGGATEQFNLLADTGCAASMAAVAYDVPAAGLVDENGTAVAGLTTASFSTNTDVATTAKQDATNFTITPVAVGQCIVYFGVAGSPRLRAVQVSVQADDVPATMELTAADPVLDLSSGATEQMTWLLKNAAGLTIDAYTDSNTYVTFSSAEPLNASVSAAGLVTGLIVNASVIVTALFTRTFRKLPFGAASHIVTVSDTVDFSVQA